MNTLVVFYSLTGNSKKIAEYISQENDYDLLELQPEEDISKKGFISMLKGSWQVIRKYTPLLKPYDVDLLQYKKIIIVTPVWVGNLTPAIHSFIKNEKIQNKKLAFIASHRGGPGKVFSHLKKALPNNKYIAEIACNSKNDWSNIRKNLDQFCKQFNNA